MTNIENAASGAIALVHGGFVDGSGWEDVYRILKKDGYRVSIVQNPTTSLADDVAATRRVVAEHKGPVILVGHSYGGAVITEAGNDPNVVGLVYITAFAPDRGESVASLIRILRRTRRFRPFFLRRRASWHSTKPSSLQALRPMWRQTRRISWRTPRSHGALLRSTARLPSPRGRASRAGIWWQRTIG
jgi:pimeloyl-ACP methyl ester carboxylesterase